MTIRRAWRLALAQLRVEPGQPKRNLAAAERLSREAAAQGAEVVVLPEALDCGWTHASARQWAGPIPGGTSYERLRALASELEIYLCAGLVERAGANLFNAAVLLSPQGELLLRYRKLNELRLAHGLYDLGDSLAVARTPLGTVGVMICADAFAPGQVISRTLGMMGADCILSPSSWAVPPDHDPEKNPYGQLWLDHYGPVARDFRIWIAGVSNVGPVRGGDWNGWKCIGCSLLLTPDGDVAVRGPYGENAETVMVHRLELAPRPARGCDWEEFWKTEREQKGGGLETPSD